MWAFSSLVCVCRDDSLMACFFFFSALVSFFESAAGAAVFVLDLAFSVSGFFRLMKLLKAKSKFIEWMLRLAFFFACY